MRRPEPDWKTIDQFVQDHPDGAGFEEIAEVFGCTHQRIQQVVSRALRKILTRMSGRNIWNMTDLI